MYVHSIPESLGEVGVAAQVRHDAQFNLGIVCTHYEPVRNARHKGLANFLATLCAHRNVLQVGIGTGQAPGSCEGLVEGGVHPSIAGRYVGREGLYVGREELFHRPVFQNLIHDGVTVCNGYQGGLVCCILPLGAALFGLRVQLKLVKEEVSHLFGGGDIQGGLAGHFPYAGFALRKLLPQAVGKYLQLRHVHFHAVPFHLSQHFGQRLLHGVVEIRQVFPELVSQRNEHGSLLEARGIVFLGLLVKEGAGGNGGRSLLQRHAQIGLRQGGEFVAALGIEHVVHELDVVPLAFQAYPFGRQLVGHLLQVHAVLGHGGVFQETLHVIPGLTGNLTDHSVCRQNQLASGQHHPHLSAFAGSLYHFCRRCFLIGEFRLRWPVGAGHDGRVLRVIPGLTGNLCYLSGKISLQRGKLVLIKEGEQPRLEFSGILHVFQGDRKVHVCFDGNQQLGQGHVRLGLAELFLLTGAQFFQVLIDVFHGAVLGYELGGAHFSHALHAGHVVCRVSADGQHVNHLPGGTDAPFLAEGFFVHQFCLGPAFSGL